MRQATVVYWVALQPVFEVFVKETEFRGGDGAREQWWRQTAVERQLNTTLKEISEAVRERRRRGFFRCGEVKGGSEESDSGDDG